MDLWSRLADRGVPRSEIDRMPTKFLFDLYMQKSSRPSEQKSNLSYKTRESQPVNQLLDLSQFTCPEFLEGEAGSPKEEPWNTAKNTLAIFLPASPKAICALGRENELGFLGVPPWLRADAGPRELRHPCRPPGMAGAHGAQVRGGAWLRSVSQLVHCHPFPASTYGLLGSSLWSPLRHFTYGLRRTWRWVVPFPLHGCRSCSAEKVMPCPRPPSWSSALKPNGLTPASP